MNKIFFMILSTLILQKSLLALENKTIGDALLILLPATAYTTTLYLNDTEGQKEFYSSFATNALSTYGLKYTINRKRPNGGEHSFPSGHTSLSFQSTLFIHQRYGLYYSIPAYLGAIFVGYSRVDAKVHYTSDVVAGAIIGALSSLYFTTKYENFALEPLATNKTYGLKITFAW